MKSHFYREAIWDEYSSTSGAHRKSCVESDSRHSDFYYVKNYPTNDEKIYVCKLRERLKKQKHY